MAAESNTSYRYEGSFRPSMGQNEISFQSGGVNRVSGDRMQINSYCGVNNYNTSMAFPGNLNIISSNQMIPQIGNSLLVESVPGLKHGMAVEWSGEEQYTLEEGLRMYENLPSIMKYVKIAAMLNDKTVRDVALRCRWLTSKRRKPEDHNLFKKGKDKKDKSAGSSSKINKHSVSPLNMAPHSLFMNHFSRSESIPFEAFSGPTRHLLEQNNKVLAQISANLSMFKLQENAELFFQTRNNLEIVLSNMREMPGTMSKMPPLPVAINNALTNSLMPTTSQAMLFGSSSGIHLKQEPGC